MEVRSYNSTEEMIEDLEHAMRAADARVHEWQTKIEVGQYVVSVCEDELVFSEVLERYTEPRMASYRFVRSWSVFCPESELGDLHVSQALRVISKGDFEAARAAEWKFVDDIAGGAA